MKKERRPDQIDFIEFPATSMDGLARAKTFFAHVFKWTFQDWGDDYADVSGTGLGTGINADPDHRPRKPLVIIYSSDLEATKSKVVAAGGKITRDIFSFPGGKRFHFLDPNDNELAVWSDR
jgi:uncharacterized protein